MKSQFKDGNLVYFLEGRIDSSNADQVGKELQDEGTLFDGMSIAFDAERLEYISSAGLRVLLKFKKSVKRDIKIINVSDEVFDILDVTGFTSIFEVERQMRSISIKGCKRISSALNGEIFQLSEDEMIKVYGDSIPFSDIKKERQLAQTAMAFGIPTLIPYDIVQCENGYGIVFEKAETTSLAYLISHEPAKLEEYAGRLATLLKELHSTEVPEDKFPDIKDKYRKWIAETNDPSDSKVSVFSSLISTIPDSGTYVHGDINLNSVMVKDDELLLLDMSGSARGNSLFDLQALFASLVAIERKNEGYCLKTFGLSRTACIKFWNAFFSVYMGDRPQEIHSMNELLLKYFVLKESVLNKLENKNRYGINSR
ncbi:MAG: STAS domain-containing protein [Lachnospiraceae bacterium]|nr:STAS domain-containing protein [Lachnospiraceae bacterium]